MIDKIIKTLDLGSLIKTERLYGGLTHKMYMAETDKGKYAIKLLNPMIMKRETAIPNFERADTLEKVLEENNISCNYSLEINGKKMQKIDDQYFYIFNYYEGKSLNQEEIEIKHVKKIGEVLSKIHNIDIKDRMNTIPEKEIDFKKYIDLAKEQNSIIYDYLYDKLDILNESLENGNKAINYAPNVSVICHNDLDRKNVLWMNNEYKIIDLECLCYSNPYLDMFETALCWAGYEKGDINRELFKEFIDSYKKNTKLDMNINWESIYYLNNGRLSWLEYNIKRALLIECGSKEEQELGIREVKETIEDVVYYDKIKDSILEILK